MMPETSRPRCAHCKMPAVYEEPHEVWCVNCGQYFDGEPPVELANNSDVSGSWDVRLGPDEQGVRIEFNHMGADGVESFVTGLPRENALEFASAVLNVALEIHICGRNEGDGK